MRVIAGEAKGRRLLSPPGRAVRPTTERVRQSLMDILAPRVVGATWLDLYAGSGAVGIEALSRGAQQALFVEADTRAAERIVANLERTRLAGRARVWRLPVAVALKRLAREGRRFDVVFADPPYGAGEVERLCLAPELVRVLAPEGVLVIQHAAQEPVPPQAAWYPVRVVEYGESRVTLLSPRSPDVAES